MRGTRTHLTTVIVENPGTGRRRALLRTDGGDWVMQYRQGPADGQEGGIVGPLTVEEMAAELREVPDWKLSGSAADLAFLLERLPRHETPDEREERTADHVDDGVDNPLTAGDLGLRGS